MRNLGVGKLGESLVLRYLKGKDFSLIERNYQNSFGEIDLIMEKSSVIHFVEVKSNSVDFSPENNLDSYRSPEERVDAKKLKKIAMVAEEYLARYKLGKDWQVDVASVLIDQNTKQAKVNLIENVGL